MIYPKIEDCIARAEQNKYVLATMVSKRAKDLITRNAGQNVTGKEKQISSAMREIVDGKIMPTTTVNQNSRSK
ncbi:MAG: DNA-directed RNA polymerase subunit omega [Clostridia bacterium]|nr:DNA-directed RNA polymerase subunit omega [Clostridia bacterium]